jgi:4-hydroxy-3-methylbut-2-enyl diphosphate reductase
LQITEVYWLFISNIGKNMQIRIDETAGFCWGVVKTIETVEEVLKLNPDKDVYILGEIIHNPAEITRLENKGLKTITHEEMRTIDPDKSIVIIRAHGEPPETYRLAEGLRLNIIDATCPLVKNLHARVREYYESGCQIVIFGERDHAEVIGIRGVCNDECFVIKSSNADLSALDFSRKTVLVSQTTMDRRTFKEIAESLAKNFNLVDVLQKSEEDPIFKAKDTICKFVSGRGGKLGEFVSSSDVVLFVAGRKSSNGKSLYNFCRSINLNTHFIESPEEMEREWFDGAETVGITGATSTPQWYLAKIKEELEKMI